MFVGTWCPSLFFASSRLQGDWRRTGWRSWMRHKVAWVHFRVYEGHLIWLTWVRRSWNYSFTFSTTRSGCTVVEILQASTTLSSRRVQNEQALTPERLESVWSLLPSSSLKYEVPFQQTGDRRERVFGSKHRKFMDHKVPQGNLFEASDDEEDISGVKSQRRMLKVQQRVEWCQRSCETSW